MNTQAQQSKRFLIEKLGRDKYIDIFKNKGIRPNIRFLTEAERLQALKNKLLEESQEVFHAFKKEDLIEELADVQEVILTLMQYHDITESDIETCRLAKKAHAGGFEKGTYFHFADVPLDCPDIEYFLANPEKYPEIEPELE